MKGMNQFETVIRNRNKYRPLCDFTDQLHGQ